MSQSVFAATLNVKPKTVQAWEQGNRVPSGSTARLLEIMEKEPGVVGLVVNGEEHASGERENQSIVVKDAKKAARARKQRSAKR